MKHKRKILILMIMCVVIFATVTLATLSLKRVILRKIGLMVVQKARSMAFPVDVIPNIPPDRVSARRNIVNALHNALARHDFEQAAFLNSVLVQEAFQRAYRTERAWEEVRDAETDLVPRATHPKCAYWNTKDAAADLFPFLLLASQCLAKNSEQIWLNALAKEREICGPMPCTIRFQPTRKIEKEDLSDVIFGASEYAKDGLLAVAERSGRGPWFSRLEEVMQALIDNAYVQTKRGKICSSNTEVNGEMLQVLSRLYWATQKDEYLQMAERIAETYLFDIFPKNRNLPTHDWDFVKGQPASSHFRFRDHGSEIIPGLTELYLLEKLQGRTQAVRYRNPLKQFLELVLTVGRTEDGLWYNTVDTKTYKPIDKGVVDTWGYILNAYKMFDIAEGTNLYGTEIRRTMQAVASRKSFAWERHLQDGYADAIESMLYLLPWFDIPECHYWVDDEIEVMFSKQLPSGFINEQYLDGNFIRTSLLYAIYKTQGIMAHPWREDVRLGAVYDKGKKELYVYISVDAKWEGVLKFDLPRHRIIWNLPVEYPRLNATPEWFVVDPQKTYRLVDLDTDEEFSYSGRLLAEGLKVSLDRKKLKLCLKIAGTL